MAKLRHCILLGILLGLEIHWAVAASLAEKSKNTLPDDGDSVISKTTRNIGCFARTVESDFKNKIRGLTNGRA
ncbi:unnamed protein product [Clavelina lepadiformis]|uniref:Uncharacterized protein n=1 Tax=Clavelina lepadiformis TaxID=159417 RepID=A0ABP0FKP9_CLALP